MTSRFLLVASLTACLACGGMESSPGTAPAHDAAIDVADGSTPTAEGSTPEAEAATPTAEASMPAAVDDSIARIHIDYVCLGCATCSPTYRPVDYDRQTRLMSWPACDDGGVGSSVDAGDAGVSAVSRVLSTSEAQQLEALLKSVTYTDNPACGGYDGQEYYMITYDNAGQMVRKYSAQNINCYGYPAAPAIRDVYALLAMFRG